MNVFRPSTSPPPLDLPRKLTLPSGESFNHCSLKHFSNKGSYHSHARYIHFYEIAHLGPPSFYEKKGHTTVGYGFIGDIYWDLGADPAQLFIRRKDEWVLWSAPQPPTHPIFSDRCLWGTTDPSLDPQGRFGFGWFRLDTLLSRGILLINFSHDFSSLTKDITKALRNNGGEGAQLWADPQTQKWTSWSFSEGGEDGKIMAVLQSSPLPVNNRPSTSQSDNISSSTVGDLMKQVKLYKNLWIDAERGRKELEIRLRNEKIARIQDYRMHDEKFTNAEQEWKKLAIFFPGASK